MPDVNNKLEKIKILHITFNMGIGGTEQVIRQIVKNSDPERFLHEILCIDGYIGVLGQELQSKDIHIESIQRKPGTDLTLAGFINRYIRKHRINVLHCHQYTPYFYGVLGVLFTHAKVIFTEHGRFFPDRHHFKRRFINPLLALRTAHITAISKATADAVAKYEYFNRKRIKVIYNGIKDLSNKQYNREQLLGELNLSPDYRYIGTIARLQPIKNQSMMINAFQMVKQKLPDIRLIIIGDGACMSDLKQQTQSLGLVDDVVFTGFLDNPQRFISLFDIFLLSSFSEGTSMTLLEAMSLSKPCVVTDVGGNPEIVEQDITGLVTPSDNAKAFGRAIMSLLDSKILRLEMGEAGYRHYIGRFSIQYMINAYEQFYEPL